MENIVTDSDCSIWFNEILKTKTFLKTLSEYEKEKLGNFIGKSIKKEYLTLNGVLCINPTLELKDISTQYLDDLEKVKTLIKENKKNERSRIKKKRNQSKK